VAGDRVAIDALGFFAEPFDVSCAIEDFALGFSQRLAHFDGQDRGEVVSIGDHQVIELAENGGTFLARLLGPFLLGLVGGIDGATGFGAVHVGQGGDDVAIGRIGDVEGLAAIALGNPFAGDKRLVGDQRGVLELG
jgi:hypothetical protein